MCDPLTIAGVALSAGSALANNAAQSRVQEARDDALAAERIRQGQLDQQAQALNTQSQDRYQDFQGQEQAEASKLAEYFTSQEVPEPSAEAALPTAANNLVVREEAKQRGQARDFTNRTGEALGNLRAFGQAFGTNSRLQARDAAQIGQIGGFKRGSQGVLPYELDEASRAGAGMATFGDILGGLGGFATMAGLSGATPFGIGAKASPVAAAAPNSALNTATPRLGSLFG